MMNTIMMYIALCTMILGIIWISMGDIILMISEQINILFYLLN
jgi:hypothetical protein